MIKGLIAGGDIGEKPRISVPQSQSSGEVGCGFRRLRADHVEPATFDPDPSKRLSGKLFLAPEWGRQHVARGVSPGRTGRHPPPDFPRPPPQPRATPGVGAADGGTVVVGIRVQGLTPLATC